MGPRPAPRRATTARTLATAALLAAALPGCSAATPAPHAPPSPRTTTPQELCTSLITHWARVILDGGEGEDAVRLDYQSMGLSGDQNEILRTVLDEARAERRDRGPDAARALAAREAGRRCAERHRPGTPTGGPWR
ncbi:hypothetical protein [Streptomyces sp. NPDC059564]|uniref:hypothetical protein n=1 Tax=Streptomyces sp. NPDC059564 TaxID=3346865 RepID=UPI00368C64F1